MSLHRRAMAVVATAIALVSLAGCGRRTPAVGASHRAMPAYWYAAPAPHGFSLVGLVLNLAVREQGTQFRQIRWAYDPHLPHGPGWVVGITGRLTPYRGSFVTPQAHTRWALVVQFVHGLPYFNDDTTFDPGCSLRSACWTIHIPPWATWSTLPHYGQATIPPLPSRHLWWTARMLAWDVKNDVLGAGLGPEAGDHWAWGLIPARFGRSPWWGPGGNTAPLLYSHQLIVVKITAPRPLTQVPALPWPPPPGSGIRLVGQAVSATYYAGFDAATGTTNFNVSPTPPPVLPQRWHRGGTLEPVPANPPWLQATLQPAAPRH